MVSIIGQESPSDMVGRIISQGIQQNLPRGMERTMDRERGLGAIDRLQSDLSNANGDISKILPDLARAYTLNPNLERSGIGQLAIQNSKVQNAYGPQGGQNQMGGNQQGIKNAGMNEGSSSAKSSFVTPNPFNILNKDQMDAEARRYAAAVQDHNGYNTRYNQLQAQNETATSQREALENSALKAGVSHAELPRFMVVNKDLDPSNPSEWSQKAIRNYADVKNNDDALERAFIPGLGNGLLGQNRQEALNNLRGPVQRNAERGLEQEDRKFLADNYLTPTEIEDLYHPMSKGLEKSLEKVPRGLFPAQKHEGWKDLTTAQARKTPFVSYEEAVERDPQAMQIMQDQLSDFFLNNVDDKTSLLGIREKLWGDKDYDWRQIGPALREAEKKGLKLQPFQEREMNTIETQPPIQSLPDLFKDLSRIPQFLRGNK